VSEVGVQVTSGALDAWEMRVLRTPGRTHSAAQHSAEAQASLSWHEIGVWHHTGFLDQTTAFSRTTADPAFGRQSRGDQNRYRTQKHKAHFGREGYLRRKPPALDAALLSGNASPCGLTQNWFLFCIGILGRQVPTRIRR
jgi:hypothetical protein